MTMEFILRGNDQTCPWQFIEKKKLIDRQHSTLALPSPLTNEREIFQRLRELYGVLTVYRNAITHGRWGNNINGNLVFNFHKDNRHIQKTIKFDEVIKFADCMSLLTTQMIGSLAKDEVTVLSTIKWCLDILQPLHQKQVFGFSFPSYFIVERHTQIKKNGYITININDIKKILDSEKKNPYAYLLKIKSILNSKSETWEIPSYELEDIEALILEHSWDKFKND